MLWKVKKSLLNGTLQVPSSKSHTIRALLISTLAKGESIICKAMLGGDGKSALNAAIGLGAQCTIKKDTIYVKGIGTDFSKGLSNINLDNSGTSMRLFSSVAALGCKPRTFDGDKSLRSRPMKPLLQSLVDLGGSYTINQKNRDIPFTINGPLIGGKTTINGITSQYLSSLLIVTPLLSNNTVIDVENLNEKPYVEITLWWLKKMKIKYDVSDNFSKFQIEGNQRYKPINITVPGDFSSATFGAVAAAIAGNTLTLKNLDFKDPQGDKEIFNILERIGVSVKRSPTSVKIENQKSLEGIEIDLNTMPDALPALSVLGCYTKGVTSIVNVPQARIKETDRIKVIAKELTKMGAHIEEMDDGLRIFSSNLKGCHVKGHHDHRVVMALAIAGMIAEGETIIDTAEAADITYPSFVDDFRRIGAQIEKIK